MTVTEHGFKAEVQQLLDIMIHSLYSDREIFLRELLSNAADALDKARFEGLVRDDLVPAASSEPGVRIEVDPDARTVVVEDDGIGMTEDEVVGNLGTIAHSGSQDFLDRLKDAGPGEVPQLIGQFGVGFYSSFMVAEEVVVETRSALPGSAGVRWTSSGQGTFTVEPVEREFRGTRVALRLREDCAEFADELRAKSIVRRHSNFLTWPIHVGDEQANSGKALWAEPPSSITDDEANAFYKSVAVDWRDPALRIHVSVDSPIQYSALLFIPEERPFDLFTPRADTGPRLYARRVLIMEHAKDLLPGWLRFVQGVVDSEDISLNVSREMVQKTPVVRKIRDAVTKRILKELARLAAAEGEPAEDGEETRAAGERYADIWRNFGILLKEGLYHSKHEYGELLTPLLRFNALSHEDEEGLLSLDEYVAAMPEGQDTVWYLTATSREEALASPALEAFRQREWDVLLLTEPVDEWLVQVLEEFDGKPVKSIARGELELDEADDEGERADLSGLTPFLEEAYAGAVARVRASSRLTDSACVLVDDEQGISGNLERILRAANQDVPAASRILELNPRHPLIRNMARLHDDGAKERLEPLARLLLDNAVLLDGNVKEPAAIGRRLQELLVEASSHALEG